MMKFLMFAAVVAVAAIRYQPVDGMAVCQAHHSFTTCQHALNR